MARLNDVDVAYALILRDLLDQPVLPDRTGVGIHELFGSVSLSFTDTANAFPILSLKRTNYDAAFDELRWMLSGSTNVNDLSSSIWNAWADENGDLGPTYGAQLRHFSTGWDVQVEEVDQVAKFMVGLVRNPTSRRHLITLVNPLDEPYQALPPCISLIQGRVVDGTLHLSVYQRSADWFLGVPFDIVAWTYFLHLMAAWAQLAPGDIHFHYGSAHLYANHGDQAREVLHRFDTASGGVFGEPEDSSLHPRLKLLYVRPHPTWVSEAAAKLWLKQLQATSFSVSAYHPDSHIQAPVAI